MNLPHHQLLGAGFAWMLLLLPMEGSASHRSGGGEDTTLTASATPISSAMRERRAPKASARVARGAESGDSPSAEAEPVSETNTETESRVVFGHGVWGEGHAGLALPTSFAPGLGETYAVPGMEQYPDNQLFVFDKTGKRVFYQRGYGGGWDGTDREGKPLPAGTYFLMVEVDGLGDDVQAYVKLVR